MKAILLCLIILGGAFFTNQVFATAATGNPMASSTAATSTIKSNIGTSTVIASTSVPVGTSIPVIPTFVNNNSRMLVTPAVAATSVDLSTLSPDKRAQVNIFLSLISELLNNLSKTLQQ